MKKRVSRFIYLMLALIMAFSTLGLQASAVNYSLPSLYQEYEGYYKIGIFGDWNGTQQKYHFNTNSLANALKLDSQIGSSNTSSLSKTAYDTAVATINADTSLTAEEKAAQIEAANENVVLVTTPSSISTLDQIRAYNQANPNDKKMVRAHCLVWHGSQQPNYFFCNGFVYDSSNPDWASPATMLARLDNYIRQMMAKYASYSDVIYAWDVVNEAIDDYSGQIRNADDYQTGQWGRIFRRTDLDGDPDARLYAESEFVRAAFASARKWSDVNGVDWKLYYNDFQDSNKLYEPKMSQTIKMLKPIYEAGNIDGYGMQGRLSYSYPTIDMLEDQIKAGLTVADEISISEGDIRSDFEPNPNYDPTQPTRRQTAADDTAGYTWANGYSGSYANIGSAGGNTFDVYNSPVRRITAWGTGSSSTVANSEAVMKKQADFVADWMDLLIKYKDQVVAYQMDGTNDSSTFNGTTGCHIWNNSGNEKYSFFAMLGAPNRDKMNQAIASGPDIADSGLYTPESWQAYADALGTAEDLVDVRIYTMDGVTAVKNATAALNDAIDGLVTKTEFSISANSSTVLGSEGVVKFNISADNLVNAWVFEGRLSIDSNSFAIEKITSKIPGNNVLLTSNISADGQSAYFNLAKIGGFDDAEQANIVEVTAKLKSGAVVPDTLTASLNSMKVFHSDVVARTSNEVYSEIADGTAATKLLTVYGDLNGDEILDAADLTIVLTCFGKTQSDADWYTKNIAAMDLDGNGVINIIDVTMEAYVIAHSAH